jgi:hypothetical protein
MHAYALLVHPWLRHLTARGLIQIFQCYDVGGRERERAFLHRITGSNVQGVRGAVMSCGGLCIRVCA